LAFAGSERRRIALLDANVLYPYLIRDVLLRLAEAGLFRPLWSDDLVREMRDNILGENPHLTDRQLDHLVGQMRLAFPDAWVERYQPRIAAMTNHPKDRHVLAAAVVGKADVIVSNDRAGFPARSLEPHALVRRTADQFMVDLFRRWPDIVLRTLGTQARGLRQPISLEELLDWLAGARCTQFVGAIRNQRRGSNPSRGLAPTDRPPLERFSIGAGEFRRQDLYERRLDT
jgi:predicted nucleic acid-binding protein